MIEILAYISLLFICIKLIIKVLLNSNEIAAFNVNKIYLYFSLFVIILYIFPIIALLAPKLRSGLLHMFYPIPLFLLFYVLGVVFSRIMESKFIKIGYDQAIKIAKIFSDIKWLGIGMLLFFIVITIWWHYIGVSDQLPIIIE
jgi:hypothetical protein